MELEKSQKLKNKCDEKKSHIVNDFFGKKKKKERKTTTKIKVMVYIHENLIEILSRVVKKLNKKV